MKKLTVIGLRLDLLGTFCLAKGMLSSDNQIDKMAATYWGANPSLKESLVVNRNWAVVGLVLIGLGFSPVQ